MSFFGYNAGYIANGILNLTPRESFDFCKMGAILVDVRELEMNAFKIFRVDNIIYLPFSELDSSYNDLPRETPLIFADAVGLKSRESVLFMIDRGYRNVANLAGGIVEWEKDGMPVSTDILQRLKGPRRKSK
jgi:rhodanese-related sulfurtransferase